MMNPLNLSDYCTVYLGHSLAHSDPYGLCADLIHFALEKGTTVLQRLRGSLRILNTILRGTNRYYSVSMYQPTELNDIFWIRINCPNNILTSFLLLRKLDYLEREV